MDYMNLLTSWTSILLITLISIYFYSTRNYKYWKSRGVNGPKPVPFIGNLNQLFWKPRCAFSLDNYKKFGHIYGLYEGTKPVLSIGEPELIRDITVKDFNKFVDRNNLLSFHHIFGRSLLTTNGDEWKQMRTLILPTFSTANTKEMQTLVNSCVNRLENWLIKSNNNVINMRQVMANYTMDVLAICAFGTQIDAYNCNNQEHRFMKSAQTLVERSLRSKLYFLLNVFIPSLAKKYISFVLKDCINYLNSILRAIITKRETKNIDFIQLLIEAKNRSHSKDIDKDIERDIKAIDESLKKRDFQLEETDILANSMTFLLGGYETTVSIVAHLFQELAMNADVQQKLFEEIRSFDQNCDYETIDKMSYLDSCVKETLRMYSPLDVLQRTAAEDYDLGDTGLVIPKGMSVQIPIYAIHHDQQYYPSPDQFNPNRFMSGRTYPLIPFTYLPFGTGLRNCVGMRFALMNIKTAVHRIISKFEFSSTQNTKTVFQYKKFVPFTQALDMGTVRVVQRL